MMRIDIRKPAALRTKSFATRSGVNQKSDNNPAVERYYDRTIGLYKRVWHGDTGALHYGFWPAHVRTHRESLLEVNRFMAEKAKIKAGDHVLDAGCGVGGAVIWLSRETRAEVTGISLSEKQLETARKNAQGLPSRVSFLRQDFLRTSFKDGSFDVVWGDESVCYAKDKLEFLKEAFRILRPGGRIIITDGFIAKQRTPKQEKLYQNFCYGYVLPNLSVPEQFHMDIEKAGFQNIQSWDKTKEILPSVRRLHWLGLAMFLPLNILRWLGIISVELQKNLYPVMAQYQLITSGGASHQVFYAEKPEASPSI